MVQKGKAHGRSRRKWTWAGVWDSTKNFFKKAKNYVQENPWTRKVYDEYVPESWQDKYKDFRTSHSDTFGKMMPVFNP